MSQGDTQNGNEVNQKQVDLNNNSKIWRNYFENKDRDYSIIQNFDLSNSQIKNEDLTYIFNFNFSNLKKLWFYLNLIQADGILIFSKYNWDNLQFLSLSYNKIGNFGCKYLKQSKLPNLSKLCLNQCQIGNVGLIHLLKMSSKNLVILYFYYNKHNFSGAETIANNFDFNQKSDINFDGSLITKTIKRAYLQSVPFKFT